MKRELSFLPSMEMVKGNLRPFAQATLQYPDGSVINLTGCSVRFHMEKDGAEIVDAVATIIDAVNGVVRYEWTGSDTNVSGKCKAEFEVTFSDAKKQCWPRGHNFIIVFREPYAT